MLGEFNCSNFAAAALWDVWGPGNNPLLRRTIVTAEAAPEFKPWRHRMQVMPAEEEMERWLDNSELIAADDSLFCPELKFSLQLSPLDKAVGNVRNKQPNLSCSTGALVRI